MNHSLFLNILHVKPNKALLFELPLTPIRLLQLFAAGYGACFMGAMSAMAPGLQVCNCSHVLLAQIDSPAFFFFLFACDALHS